MIIISSIIMFVLLLLLLLVVVVVAVVVALLHYYCYYYYVEQGLPRMCAKILEEVQQLGEEFLPKVEVQPGHHIMIYSNYTIYCTLL